MYVISVSHRTQEFLVTKGSDHEYKLSGSPWMGFGNPTGDAMVFNELWMAELVLNIIKLKVKAAVVTIKDLNNGRDI